MCNTLAATTATNDGDGCIGDGDGAVWFDVSFPMALINYLGGFWQAFQEKSFIIQMQSIHTIVINNTYDYSITM